MPLNKEMIAKLREWHEKEQALRKANDNLTGLLLECGFSPETAKYITDTLPMYRSEDLQYLRQSDVDELTQLSHQEAENLMKMVKAARKYTPKDTATGNPYVVAFKQHFRGVC